MKLSPEKEEACTLIDGANDLINRLTGDFVKYHTGKGHIEIRKESPNFVIILRLERKKGVNKE